MDFLFSFALVSSRDESQDAGWSSLVARQAHNLKAAGSNPAPATNFLSVPGVHRVYVLQNPKGRRYIGLSEDPQQRLHQHNSGMSKWTKLHRPWKIIWQSETLSLSQARKLENQLKRQGGGRGFYSITQLPNPNDS